MFLPALRAPNALSLPLRPVSRSEKGESRFSFSLPRLNCLFLSGVAMSILLLLLLSLLLLWLLLLLLLK